MEEPKRKSFFDIIKQNLRLADRQEQVTRFIYIGCYKGSEKELEKLLKENIEELQKECDETHFSGFLLIYPRFFLHLIEASEETIYKHLQAVLANNNVLDHVISLPARYNVYKMYFSEWHTAYIQNPPVLLDKIEIMELEEICKQMKNCLFKIYSLCEYLMDSKKMHEVLKNLSKEVPYLLPEVTIVEYLLSIKYSIPEDLRNHLIKFNEVPSILMYNEPYGKQDPSKLLVIVED